MQTQARTLFPRAQLPALTGIRAFAAFWVFARHFRLELLTAFPFLDVFAPLMNTGYLGVDLFFILSGFILTYTHFDRLADGWNWRRAVGFLWLRLGRVWPLTAFVLLIFGGYFAYQYLTTGDPGYAAQADAGELVKHLLLIQAWIPGPLTWDGLDWSISAEWLAYVVFAVGIVALARLSLTASKRTIVILIALLTVPVMIVGCTMQDDTILLFAPNSYTTLPGVIAVRVIAEFWIGALLAILLRERLAEGRAMRFPLATVASAAAILVIYLVVAFDPHPSLRIGQPQFSPQGVDLIARSATIVVLPLFVLVIAGLAVGGLAGGGRGGMARAGGLAGGAWDPFAWLCARSPLQVGGRVSFALYLSHPLVIGLDVVLLNLNPVAPVRDLLDVGVVVAVWVFAWVLWRFIEEPSRKLARRMLPDSIRV